MRSLDPRSPRFLRHVGGLACKWRNRRGLSDADSATLRGEALAARWRAANGLEFRLLVALMQCPEHSEPVFAVLEPADFVSVPYAALFAAWALHGLPAPLEASALLTGRKLVPALPPEWWADELRATLAAMLGRRGRWPECSPSR